MANRWENLLLELTDELHRAFSDIIPHDPIDSTECCTVLQGFSDIPGSGVELCAQIWCSCC